MANLSISPCALLAIVGIFVAVLAGAAEAATSCTQYIGPYDSTCNARCESKFKDASGKGVSAVLGPAQVCKCVFDCTKVRQCAGGIGLCSSNCNNACCSEKCGAKYPQGAGYGSCDDLNVCLCSYACPA